jgi:hypothetical protein
MILCIVINGTMAFAIILVLLYCIGNLDDVLDASYPIIPICLNATGSMKATNAMVSSLIIVTYFVVAASVASVSRITWAWARDGALPKSLAIVSLSLSLCVRVRARVCVCVCACVCVWAILCLDQFVPLFITANMTSSTAHSRSTRNSTSPSTRPGSR